MGVLDQYTAIKKEASYGVAATGVFRGYETTGDGFSRDVDFVEGNGKVRGRGGLVSIRRRKVDLGASGSIESVFMTKGEGVRLEGLLGASTGPTKVTSANKTYAQKFTADAEGPDVSYTVNVSRYRGDGTMQDFQYLGAIATGFSLSVEERGDVMLNIDYDCLSETTVGSVTTHPEFPNGSMFIWEDCKASLAGADVTGVFKSFTLDVDLNMDIERYFLDKTSDKRMPLRKGIPSFTGTLSGEFKDLSEYNRFITGEPFQFILEATHPNAIEGSHYPTLRVTLPAMQYNGSTPQSDLDSLSMIELPFTALWDSGDGICVIDYQSEDTAL